MNTLCSMLCTTALFALVSGEPLQKGKAKPGTTSPMPATVMMAGSDCAICPDGLGAYEDGLDGVEASLDQYGNIIVSFGQVRSVAFSFDEPDVPAGVMPPAGHHANAYLSSRFPTPSGFLQELPVDNQQCVELNWTFTLDDPERTQFRLLFHRTGLFDVGDTSYGVVTRIDADTWRLEPVAGDCNLGNEALARVVSTPTRGRSLFTDYGTYRMPFSLTLTRQ